MKCTYKLTFLEMQDCAHEDNYSEMLCRKNRTNISALSNGEKWHFGSFSRMGHIIVQGQNLSYSACTRNTHSLWHTHTVCTWEFGLPTDRDQGSNRTWQCSPHTHLSCPVLCWSCHDVVTLPPGRGTKK